MSSIYNPASLRVKEQDGTPNVPGVVTLVFPNGSVTDLGRGAVSIVASAPAGSTVVIDETPTGNINGINDTFTLAHAPSGGLLLFVSSLGKAWAAVDYNLAGAVITFIAGHLPQTGDLISATYTY